MQNFNQNFSNFDKQLKFSQLVVSEIASYLNKKGFVAIIKWGKVGYDLVVGFPDKAGKLIKCWKKIEIKQNFKALQVGYFLVELQAVLNSIVCKNNWERDFDDSRELWFIGFYKDSSGRYYLLAFRNKVSSFSRIIWKLFPVFQGGNKVDLLLKVPICYLNFAGVISVENEKLVKAIKDKEKVFNFSLLNSGLKLAEQIKKWWFKRFGCFVDIEFPKLSPLFESPNPEISEKLKF
jgi:hypothetical protein